MQHQRQNHTGSIATSFGQGAYGNLGDIKSVGDSVYEMREYFGPGWRMYYVQRGALLLLMLGGGDKATQDSDIARAISLSKTV
jgi:putative addiction module killer protein